LIVGLFDDVFSTAHFTFCK